MLNGPPDKLLAQQRQNAWAVHRQLVAPQRQGTERGKSSERVSPRQLVREPGGGDAGAEIGDARIGCGGRPMMLGGAVAEPSGAELGTVPTVPQVQGAGGQLADFGGHLVPSQADFDGWRCLYAADRDISMSVATRAAELLQRRPQAPPLVSAATPKAPWPLSPPRVTPAGAEVMRVQAFFSEVRALGQPAPPVPTGHAAATPPQARSRRRRLQFSSPVPYGGAMAHETVARRKRLRFEKRVEWLQANLVLRSPAHCAELVAARALQRAWRAWRCPWRRLFVAVRARLRRAAAARTRLAAREAEVQRTRLAARGADARTTEAMKARRVKATHAARVLQRKWRDRCCPWRRLLNAVRARLQRVAAARARLAEREAEVREATAMKAVRAKAQQSVLSPSHDQSPREPSSSPQAPLPLPPRTPSPLPPRTPSPPPLRAPPHAPPLPPRARSPPPPCEPSLAPPRTSSPPPPCFTLPPRPPAALRLSDMPAVPRMVEYWEDQARSQLTTPPSQHTPSTPTTPPPLQAPSPLSQPRAQSPLPPHMPPSLLLRRTSPSPLPQAPSSPLPPSSPQVQPQSPLGASSSSSPLDAPLPPPPCAPGSLAASAAPQEAAYWEDVFQAQSQLVARYGMAFDQVIERNIQVARRRDAEERRRREAAELARAMANSWGAQVVELRRQGVRLPVGAGTGGRQMRERRQRRQAEEAGGGSSRGGEQG